MPRYFAFLRAINVGGHNVKMEHLRTLFETLGFTNIETFIASGNVIFESKARNARTLESKIEAHLRISLGYEVATFLRTDKELYEISRYSPFTASEIKSAATQCVGFVSEPLSVEVGQALKALMTENDQFHVHEREVYWLSRVGQGQSTFSNAVFERMHKGKSTFRNVNTILRMATKYLSS